VAEPWLLIALIGAAIAGYGFLLPRGDDAPPSRDDSFERLMEDLEAENRGLLDAITRLKAEQDDTVERLGRRIHELEQEVDRLKERGRGAAPMSYADATFPAGAVTSSSVSAETEDSPKQATSAVSAIAQAAGTGGPAAADGAGEGSAGEGDEAKPPLAIHERYAQLLELYRRGRSIEQISKAMNMNKGEVQLILQLAKREETARA